MTGTLASPAALTAADRCDRCGAAARVRAVLSTGGELLFCNHHARSTALGSSSWLRCSTARATSPESPGPEPGRSNRSGVTASRPLHAR